MAAERETDVPRWKKPKELSSLAWTIMTGSGRSELYLKIPIERIFMLV